MLGGPFAAIGRPVSRASVSSRRNAANGLQTTPTALHCFPTRSLALGREQEGDGARHGSHLARSSAAACSAAMQQPEAQQTRAESAQPVHRQGDRRGGLAGRVAPLPPPQPLAVRWGQAVITTHWLPTFP